MADLDRRALLALGVAMAGVLGRLLAERLTVSLKQPVIVENRPGAGGIVATSFVAKSPPDGYTLLLNVPLLVQTPHLFGSKAPYDPLNDLAPVAELVTTPLWFAVGADRVPARSFKEYLEAAKRQPADYNYASIGPGSTGHLLGNALAQEIGVPMTHVAYKGSAPAMQALLSGEITGVFLDYVTLRPQVDAGKVRLLAVTGKQRTPLTPQVPTLAELGYPGFEPAIWAGIFVASKTPDAILNRLESEIRTVSAQPDFQARIRELGYVAGQSSRQQFAEQVRADYATWGDLVRKAGVKLD